MFGPCTFSASRVSSTLVVGLAVTCAVAARPASPDCLALNAVSPQCKPAETAHHREYFYIGGHYVPYPVLGGNLVYDQLYVEKLIPAKGIKQPHPLIFFHGGGSAGNVWLQTPDNREGFASYFLDRGYAVYIIDQTSVGRATQEDIPGYPLRIGSTAEIAESGFTVPENANAYPQSQLHTQWPGKGTIGDPIFDAFVAQFIPLTSNLIRQELSMRASGCKLLSLIGGRSYLISHSIGALHPILLSDQCPQHIAGNINLEPATIPFQSYTGNATSPVGRTPNRPWGLTNTRITYSPPASSPSELKTVDNETDTPRRRSCIYQAEPARTLPQIAKVPYVALTGEASPHITYDQCVVNYLRQAGVKVDWIKLGEIGISGNGHFGFLEKNNLDIAAVVEKWIKRRDRG